MMLRVLMKGAMIVMTMRSAIGNAIETRMTGMWVWRRIVVVKLSVQNVEAKGAHILKRRRTFIGLASKQMVSCGFH